MNAGLGARFLPEDAFLLLVFLAAFFRAAGRRADFLLDFFLPAVFLLVVAIASLPNRVRTVRASEPAKLPCQTVHRPRPVAIGKIEFPLWKSIRVLAVEAQIPRGALYFPEVLMLRCAVFLLLVTPS